MTKEFLKWMAAGLVAILLSVVNYIASGGPITIKTIGALVLGPLLVRAANFIVNWFGPKPDVLPPTS